MSSQAHPRVWDAADALRGLGITAAQVAAVLRLKGIRGHRNDEYQNPLCVFLEAKFGGVWRIANARVWYWEFIPDFLPTPCRVFLEAFDGGAYSDLDINHC